MNIIRTSLKLNQKQVKILLFLLFLGIIIGFLLYHKIDGELIEEQLLSIPELLQQQHLNFIFVHSAILLILIASSFMFFGLVLFPLYFVWEIACVCYALFSFFSVYSLSGFLFGLLYQIVIKLPFLICLVILFKNVYYIVKNNLFGKFNLQEGQSISFTKQYKMIILAFFFVFVYDVLLYFFGGLLLAKLCFIIN